MKIRVMMRSFLLAGSVVGVAASAAVAAPDYSLLTTIAVPTVGMPTNMQPNGTFNAFDDSDLRRGWRCDGHLGSDNHSLRR